MHTAKQSRFSSIPMVVSVIPPSTDVILFEVNSQLISNIATDALSAEKYYSPHGSQGIPCCFGMYPPVILGEEVAAPKLTLFDITKQICDAVQARAELDGLIENIPEIYALLKVIHDATMNPFMLLLQPESDDSAQLSQIETENLLACLVEEEMNKRLQAKVKEGNMRKSSPETNPDFICRGVRRRRNLACVRILLSQHLDDDTIKQQKRILTRFGLSVATLYS
ncbi:hypothetical protein ACFE04_028808 [Oxalis oulophora]